MFLDLEKIEEGPRRAIRCEGRKHLAEIFGFLSRAFAGEVLENGVKQGKVHPRMIPASVEITGVDFGRSEAAIQVDGTASGEPERLHHPLKSTEQPLSVWRCGEPCGNLLQSRLVDAWRENRPRRAKARINKGRDHAHNNIVVFSDCPVW